MQVVDFIEVRKWLQKGSVLQHSSNLCHYPLIPHQSNSVREALVYHGCSRVDASLLFFAPEPKIVWFTAPKPGQTA